VKAAELAKLNELCAVREMALIADEVFLDFPLGPEKTGQLLPATMQF